MLLADVSEDTLYIEGITVINGSKGADADFVIHGDTVDDILLADVSGDFISFGGDVRLKGSLIINGDGAATSIVRIEGDTDEYLLVTDPVNDRVGIGVAAPVTKLHASGSTILGCASAAVADGDLGVSQINLAVDETGHNLLIKVKYSDTTVKTATVALT
jgi:hypothetical protein